jgi:hypothetical protein
MSSLDTQMERQKAFAGPGPGEAGYFPETDTAVLSLEWASTMAYTRVTATLRKVGGFSLKYRMSVALATRKLNQTENGSITS